MSNILPKKSWHVYDEDNRKKVQKDIEAHKEEEEAKLNHQRRSEAFDRLTKLKARAGVAIEHEAPQEKVGKRPSSAAISEGAPEARGRKDRVKPQTFGDLKSNGRSWYESAGSNHGKLVNLRQKARLEVEDPLMTIKRHKNQNKR